MKKILVVTALLGLVVGSAAAANIVPDSDVDQTTVQISNGGPVTSSNWDTYAEADPWTWLTSAGANQGFRRIADAGPDGVGDYAAKSTPSNIRNFCFAAAIELDSAVTGNWTLSYDYNVDLIDSTLSVLNLWAYGYNTSYDGSLNVKTGAFSAGSGTDLIGSTVTLADTSGAWSQNNTQALALGVTGYDHLLVWFEWDSNSAETVAIDNITLTPEPATMSLLALGGIGVLIRRRRR